MRIAWLDNICLDKRDNMQFMDVVETARMTRADVFVITGNISKPDTLREDLQRLAGKLQQPTYFVLGNRDFYGSKIYDVRKAMDHLSKESHFLTYLSTAAPMKITNQVCVVGHDGWADAQYGNFMESLQDMKDYEYIQDFQGISKQQLGEKLTTLGKHAARLAYASLRQALEDYDHIYFVTHVPPFKEACWVDGNTCDDSWLPHLTCKAMGDMLLREMKARPDKQMTLLCGHTDGLGFIDILPNLYVMRRHDYHGKPILPQVFEEV